MTAIETPPAAQSKQGEAAPSNAKTSEVKAVSSDTGSLLAAEPQETAPDAKSEGKAAKATETPKPYEFKAPEGANFDPEAIKVFGEFAQKNGITQEVGQKLLDSVAPVLHARFAEQFQQAQVAMRDAQREAWAKETTADKEFGGERLKGNLVLARKGALDLGGEALLTLLADHELGSNALVLKAFAKHGKAVTGDQFVAGSRGGGMPKSRRLEDVLYADQK